MLNKYIRTSFVALCAFSAQALIADTLRVVNNAEIPVAVGFFYRAGESIEKTGQAQIIPENSTVNIEFPAWGGFSKQRYIYATTHTDIIGSVFSYPTFDSINKAVGMTVLPVGKTGITSGFSKAQTVTINITPREQYSLNPLILTAS